MILEPETSHHLLSESWIPRRAGGIIQSESGGLRTRGPKVWVWVWTPRSEKQEPQCLRTRKDRQLSSRSTQEDPPFLPFCSIGPSMDWMMPLQWTRWEWPPLLSLPVQTLISRNRLTAALSCHASPAVCASLTQSNRSIKWALTQVVWALPTLFQKTHGWVSHLRSG